MQCRNVDRGDLSEIFLSTEPVQALPRVCRRIYQIHLGKLIKLIDNGSPFHMMKSHWIDHWEEIIKMLQICRSLVLEICMYYDSAVADIYAQIYDRAFSIFIWHIKIFDIYQYKATATVY